MTTEANPSGARLLSGIARAATFPSGPSETVDPRKKGGLTPEEHAVCDAVTELRKKMALSQRQMARQVGTTTRSICRWEKHLCVPWEKHLVRLEQLQRMLDEPDLRDRIAPPQYHDGRRQHKRRSGMPAEGIRRYGRQLMGAMLLKLGGRIELRRDELLPPNAIMHVWRSEADGSFVLEIERRRQGRHPKHAPALDQLNAATRAATERMLTGKET